MIEPFGFFKATPFGWEDCAETDEDSVALYEASDLEAARREEREACARLCDAMPASGLPADCAAAIRARKNKEATEN